MKNSRGSALLNAIVIAAIIAAISGVIMTQTQVTDKMSRAPRIRSAMAVMQGRVQAIANQFTSYSCPPNDIKSCTLRSGLFANVQEKIVGGQCGAPSCLVYVESATFDGASMKFEAYINYNGTEVPIKHLHVLINIPPEVLAQQGAFVCQDPNAPIFQGYKSDGSINCKGFTDCDAPNSLSNQGTFITAFDNKTLKPFCNQLGLLQSCPNNQYMSNYYWSGSTFTSTCTPRVDPFTAMNYAAPAPVAAGAIINAIATAVTTSTSSTTTSSTTTTTGPTGCGWSMYATNGGIDPGGQCTGCPGGPGTSCHIDSPAGSPCDSTTVGSSLHEYQCDPGGANTTWQTTDYTCVCSAPPPSPTTTTTLMASCASSSDPFTYGNFTACSSSAPPGNPTCVSGTGMPTHGTNYVNTTVSLSMHILWHGIDSTCYYSSFLPPTSTGGVWGSCTPAIPGVSAGTVDFFNTSPGPTGGMNILGPGPGYSGSCP